MASKLVALKTKTSWWRLDVTDEDVMEGMEAAELQAMLEQLILIRRFEEKLLKLSVAGILHGPAHSSIGQDGAAVGAMSVLTSTDKINGTHRMHHQFLAKALNHVRPAGYSPLTQDLPAAMHEVVMRTYAEILGLTPGYCGGRGGSMHLRYTDAGVYGSNAIVGGNPPHAVGYALADKLNERKDISVAFFGDGATQNGATYEAMNLAALYATPTVFFIENNLYAVSTHVSEQTREVRLSARGLSLGIPGIEFDGMSVLAARRAMSEARAIIERGEGPVVLEAKTYRYFHQSGAQKGSAFGYREKAEEAQWAERDPLPAFEERLRANELIDDAGMARLEQRAGDLIDSALSQLLENYGDSRTECINAALWPDPALVDVGIRGDLSELADLPVRELQDQAQADPDRGSIRRRDVCRHVEEHGIERPDHHPRRRRAPPARWHGGGDEGHRRTFSRSVSSEPPSARTGSRAWHSALRSTACGRWSRSCIPTSRWWRQTSCSTRSARCATCSAASSRCECSCAAASRPEPATARSIQWTPAGCLRSTRAGASSRRRRPTTTSGC